MDEQNNLSSHIQFIRGLPFPNSKRFTKKNIEESMDYVPKDGDIIIASYPKTGTTWLQYIVLQILSKGEYFPAFDDVLNKVAPFIEMVGVNTVDAMPEPRIYKHHIPYNMVQKNQKSKCIYVHRNPEDVIVSYYHFLQKLGREELDFDGFIDSILTGSYSYGNYFSHVLSFYGHREDSNLLIVSYERLYANRKEEILKIAKFLGEEHELLLLKDEEVLNKIIRHTSFEHMKNNLYMTHLDSYGDASKPKNKRVNFFRKGIVGDGKNVLTEKQRIRIKEFAEEIMKGTGIIDIWYAEKNSIS